ncbi:GNAT family N-acetyltransferase [Chelatococcus sambhunathii]|uniref:GNAT family N-acetyltransferase n=1 Tax=Chelatococcus sambhunathii TaxID=363953 RepID=A0ABU1DCT6_9HYPH|nr:GNAT family N-acetyltransferase [Chelatococcus sambhunathii]MDR4305854.1 GNAT family N-acetyltransferase [Chelatococcus sambhunathii]
MPASSPASFEFEDSLLSRPCATALAGVKLRRIEAADAGAMANGLADFSVSRNLVAVPHPYTLADAREFIAGPAASPRMLCAAIEVDGAFGGCVAIDAQTGAPELGYWLAAPLQGRGIGSAAARALVDLAFAATDVPAIVSGHFFDNDASASVLAKLGFRRTGVVETRSRARNETVRLLTMSLGRTEWLARRPSIETRRLTMAQPTLADADEIALIAADRSLGLMTAAVPKPFTLDDARAFVLSSARRRRPASMTFSIRMLTSGALVGGIGWSEGEGGGLELGYWLGAEHRGRGIATEAARAVLEAAFDWTGASCARARCRVVNPASRGVLERCGFQWEGASLVRSPGAPGAVAVDVFRLDRDVFFSLRDWGMSAVRTQRAAEAEPEDAA